jgi:CheY-like chemotaxis protein/anti-sigma regulatory factor (Ser/Thr protein kinase)
MSKILVIEDQEAIRENIMELLEQKGYLVSTAINATEGSKIASSFLPDIILSDLLLPDYSGIDLIKKFKNDDKLKDIPIIIITGESQNETYRSAMIQGADDFIVKPFKAKELYDAVEAQLSKARVRKLNFELIAELSEQSPLPILRIDISGNIIYSNPAAKFLVEKQMIKKIMDIIHPVITGNFEFEFPVDEKIFNCVASYNDAQKYHNLYFIDNTVQVNAFYELEKKNVLIERKNENLSQFTYIVAHDLKAPVINIRQLLDLILQEAQQKSENENKKSALLGLLNESLTKLETVILDVSSILKSREEIQRQQKIVFSVRKQVNVILKEFRAKIKEIGAEVIISIDDSFKLNFPLKEFSTIMINLIDNAIKFKDPQRILKINISASKIKDGISLKIKDNGLGFDEKIAKGKLMVFYQKMHNNIDGKGLGLQIVKNILESNDGEIQYMSQPGVGTIFQLTFKDDSKNT